MSARAEQQTKGFVICCEVGVLLTPDDDEFEAYTIVYDHKYGYYDENQATYKLEDLDEAISYVKQYVAEGVDMTYGIITDQGCFHYGERFDSDNIEGFTYLCEDIIYSMAKINGKIIENFI